jgi:hypothetical protein
MPGATPATAPERSPSIAFDRTIAASISSVLDSATSPVAPIPPAAPVLSQPPSAAAPSSGFTSFGPPFIPPAELRRATSDLEVELEAVVPLGPVATLKRWFRAVESKVHAERITLPTALALMALACAQGLAVVLLISYFREKPAPEVTTKTLPSAAQAPSPKPSAASAPKLEALPATSAAAIAGVTVPPDGSEKAAPA